MVKKLEPGERIGGPTQITTDPDSPSFDPATHEGGTDKKIRFLLEDHTIHLLSPWERNFLMEVYGKVPLSKKQHITVAKIYQKHTQPAEPENSN